MDFDLDHAGLAQMLHSPEFQALVLQRAEMAAEVARAIAPVGKPPEDKHPGEYRESIHVEKAESPKRDRVATRLVADAPHAAAVEFGNPRSAAHHVLASVIDVAERG